MFLDKLKFSIHEISEIIMESFKKDFKQEEKERRQKND